MLGLPTISHVDSAVRYEWHRKRHEIGCREFSLLGVTIHAVPVPIKGAAEYVQTMNYDL